MSQVKNIVEKAEFFARGAHAGQTYGAAAPYSAHLAAVVAVLGRFNVSHDSILAAGWLHDVLEDTQVEPATVIHEFGDTVFVLVEAVTNEPGANRRERHEKTYPKIRQAGDDAVILKLADRIANVEASLQDLSGGKLGMYKKEHVGFKNALYSHNIYPGSTLGRMWVHLDRLMATETAPKKHKLIAIGPLGSKRVYIDVPRSEALRRYYETVEGGPLSQGDIEEFEFTDEFCAYDVFVPKAA